MRTVEDKVQQKHKNYRNKLTGNTSATAFCTEGNYASRVGKMLTPQVSRDYAAAFTSKYQVR